MLSKLWTDISWGYLYTCKEGNLKKKKNPSQSKKNISKTFVFP